MPDLSDIPSFDSTGCIPGPWKKPSLLYTIAETGTSELTRFGLFDPHQLDGWYVRIDGKTYLVLDADAFAIHRSKDHPYRLPFALLVRPEGVSAET